MGVRVLKGRNVKIEVSLTTATAKSVTAVSKASPGVATSATHGLTNGTIGFFAASAGMPEIEGMAISVANQAAGTFELEKLDTTSFGTFTTADFTPVATWATLSTATTLQMGGGDASKLDLTTLLDTMRQEENGLLAAQTISIGSFVPDGVNSAIDAVEKAALAGAYLVFRVTFPSGLRLIWRGQPSLPGMDTSVDAPVTGGFNCSVTGRAMRLPV